MREVPLGRTGLRVSQMVFGGAPIGGLYELVGEQTAAALEAARAAGIRAFDTAPHYGVGLSERRIGAFLAGRPRAEFVLSTKVGRRLVTASSGREITETGRSLSSSWRRITGGCGWSSRVMTVTAPTGRHRWKR